MQIYNAPIQLRLGGGGAGGPSYKAVGYDPTQRACAVSDAVDGNPDTTLWFPPFVDLSIPGGYPLSGTYRLTHAGSGVYLLGRCGMQNCTSGGYDFGWSITLKPLDLNPPGSDGAWDGVSYPAGCPGAYPHHVYCWQLTVAWENDECISNGTRYPAPAGINAYSGWFPACPPCTDGAWNPAYGQTSSTFSGLLGLLPSPGSAGLTFKTDYGWCPTLYWRVQDYMAALCECPSNNLVPYGPGNPPPASLNLSLSGGFDYYSQLYDGESVTVPAYVAPGGSVGSGFVWTDADVIALCCGAQQTDTESRPASPGADGCDSQIIPQSDATNVCCLEIEFAGIKPGDEVSYYGYQYGYPTANGADQPPLPTGSSFLNRRLKYRRSQCLNADSYCAAGEYAPADIWDARDYGAINPFPATLTISLQPIVGVLTKTDAPMSIADCIDCNGTTCESLGGGPCTCCIGQNGTPADGPYNCGDAENTVSVGFVGYRVQITLTGQEKIATEAGQDVMVCPPPAPALGAYDIADCTPVPVSDMVPQAVGFVLDLPASVFGASNGNAQLQAMLAAGYTLTDANITVDDINNNALGIYIDSRLPVTDVAASGDESSTSGLVSRTCFGGTNGGMLLKYTAGIPGPFVTLEMLDGLVLGLDFFGGTTLYHVVAGVGGSPQAWANAAGVVGDPPSGLRYQIGQPVVTQTIGGKQVPIPTGPTWLTTLPSAAAYPVGTTLLVVSPCADYRGPDYSAATATLRTSGLGAGVGPGSFFTCNNDEPSPGYAEACNWLVAFDSLDGRPQQAELFRTSAALHWTHPLVPLGARISPSPAKRPGADLLALEGLGHRWGFDRGFAIPTSYDDGSGNDTAYNPCHAGNCTGDVLSATITNLIPMGSLELDSRYNFLLSGLLPDSPLTVTPICKTDGCPTYPATQCILAGWNLFGTPWGDVNIPVSGGAANGSVTVGEWTYAVTRQADNADGTAEFQIAITGPQNYSAQFSTGNHIDCLLAGDLPVALPGLAAPWIEPYGGLSCDAVSFTVTFHDPSGAISATPVLVPAHAGWWHWPDRLPGQEVNDEDTTVVDVLRVYGGQLMLIRSQYYADTDGVSRWHHLYCLLTLSEDCCALGGQMNGEALYAPDPSVAGCRDATDITVDIMPQCLEVCTADAWTLTRGPLSFTLSGSQSAGWTAAGSLQAEAVLLSGTQYRIDWAWCDGTNYLTWSATVDTTNLPAVVTLTGSDSITWPGTIISQSEGDWSIEMPWKTFTFSGTGWQNVGTLGLTLTELADAGGHGRFLLSIDLAGALTIGRPFGDPDDGLRDCLTMAALPLELSDGVNSYGLVHLTAE